jgi:FAD/FMN-containing dehydrogenase
MPSSNTPETETNAGTSSTRRDFLRLAGAGLLAWTPAYRVFAGDTDSPCTPPPQFPTSIPVYLQAFKNWSEEIVLDAVWTAVPKSADEVVQVVNWAAAHGYRIRARGSGHNWCPILVAPGTNCDTKVILLDTREHLTAMSIDTTATPPTVTAQCGILMGRLLEELEKTGLGMTATPAPGELTLGGVLAIGGHGTAVPAVGETLLPGHTFGSIGNLMVSMTVVAWNPSTSRYELRRISRADPEASSLCPHLGRTFVIEATLRVGANVRLRCQSITDIPNSELFAPALSSGRTFASFLDASGRAEALVFPFCEESWFKVWTVSPEKPADSKEVTEPYNYPFSDSVGPTLNSILQDVLSGSGFLTPALGEAQMLAVKAGLLPGNRSDLWGWSKNLMLYIRPSTLRVTESGQIVLCRRADVQRVANEFYGQLMTLRDAYRGRGDYPINSAIEIRVNGLDRPEDSGVPGARSPRLSPLRPVPDHPEWDTAVWLNTLTVPGTRKSIEFFRDLEQWMIRNYSGAYARLRTEWSKGWAFTESGPWTDASQLTGTIPASLTEGQQAGDDFRAAVDQLDALDPLRIFSTPFLDQFMPPTQRITLERSSVTGENGVIKARLLPSSPGPQVVETSPDMTTWQPVSTNAPGPVEITVDTSGSRRFYRMVPLR